MEQEQRAGSEHKTQIKFYACESSLEHSALNLHQSRAEHLSVSQSSQAKEAWPETAKQAIT